MPIAAVAVTALLAVVIGLIARNRGRPFMPWFIGGLIFWPLWLIFAARLPRQGRDDGRPPRLAQGEREAGRETERV